MLMNRSILAAMAIFVAGCSSAPKPPTVDDSKKRPVNVSQALDIQMCRTELSATKIVLTETLTTEQRRQALALASVQPTPPISMTSVIPTVAFAREPNQVFVINFPLGSADIKVSSLQGAQLVEQARAAKFILIRGRTDAVVDSMAETRLAQRRAEAAYKYLVDVVRLPPEGIRLSWQGAGDPFLPSTTALDRQANRRVEIELYQAKPEVQVLNLLNPPRQVGVADIL